MKSILFAVVSVMLLAACETHVKGPEKVVLTPEGESVVVTLAGGETLGGELVEVAGTYLLLKKQGRYLAIDLSSVQRVQITRYSLSLDGSLSELPPYSRYPQGLTTEQRTRLLEESGQKDTLKLFEVPLTSEKLGTTDTKTEPGRDVASKEHYPSPAAEKESHSDNETHFFDTRTGLNWIVVVTKPVDLSTANIICASLETGDNVKYRVPSLREFEELWKRYKNDERISIFKGREYCTDGKHNYKSGAYVNTFSFSSGSEGPPSQVRAADLTCVGK